LPVFLGAVTRACGDDRALLAQVLAGLRRYQAMPPPAPRASRPLIASCGNVALRDYGNGKDGPLVVMVPSMINPPTVLDLAPGNSLLAGLATAGLRPLLVEWGAPEEAGLAEMVETRLAPLLAGLGEPVALAGYCLGGTLALAAASLLGEKVSRLALLATPWHFSGYGDPAAARLAEWWQSAGPLAETLGVLPMDLLQPAFWSLDGDSLAAKYARFASMPDGPQAEAFTVLEDWTNTGQPLSLAAARELAETLFDNDASGHGNWRVGGRKVRPEALAMPILDIIALRDRIVLPGAALTTSGPGKPLALDAGHVGMVVGGRAPTMLWKPLADFLRS
jgi:polyhydroxyalkanoate synthase